MKGWTTSILGDVANIQLGKMLSQKSREGDNQHPYLRNANVQWNRFEIDDMATMHFSPREQEKFSLRRGDILVCEGGEPGRSAIWNEEIVPCYYQKALHRVRLRDESYSPRFFLYSLWHASLSGSFDSGQSKTTIAHLPLVRLKQLKVQYPIDGTIQRNIATAVDAALGSVGEAAEAAKTRVRAAEELKTSILKEAFLRREPVSIGLPFGPAPSGWTWKRLTDLAKLESGHTPSRKRPEWWGGDIPWIALPDIRALDGQVAMETKEMTNEEGIANSSARILPKGTVVLSRTASVGFVAIMGRPMATSQDFVNWVCGDDLDPRFLMHALRASRRHLLSNASGAVHKTIYMPAVKDFHLCLPDRPEQERIAARLDEQLADAARIVAGCREELAAIEALPAALLRRVFSPEAAAC